MGLRFRRRNSGTPNQIGKIFPVIEKKKLPAKIALGKRSAKPTWNNKESGITNLEYKPPTIDHDGEIAFDFEGEKVYSKIRLVDKEKNIGQWSVTEPTVYLDKKIGIGWIRYLSLHEALESYLQKHYNINWQPFGHLLAEAIEHREFLKRHPESEWKLYDKQVRQVAHMNLTGGKANNIKLDLRRAFQIFTEKKNQLSAKI